MPDTPQEAEPSPEKPAVVYVDYHEERDNAGHSKEHKQRSIQFFLHTDDGSDQVLAVIGDDLGDAHYKYYNAPSFQSYGTIEVRTRKEVISWLEMIMHESRIQASGGLQEEVEHLGEQTPSNPDGLYYVRHEQKRDHLPDGRRVNRWFLIDQNDDMHLAVQGEERDARDGHYIYSSQEPFAHIKPMGTCTNQQQVMHWLENFITHHGKSGMHVGDHIRSGPHVQQHVRGRSPHKRRSPRPPGGWSPEPSANPERRSKRARLPSERAGEPAAKRIASPQAPTPSPMSKSTPAPALAAAAKAAKAGSVHSRGSEGAAKVVAKAPAKTPPAHASDLDLAAGAEGSMQVMGASAGGRAHAPKAGGQGGVRLGGAAEASQARRIKAVQAAAKSQVAALERVVKADVCKQLQTSQKAHEAHKAAAVQWCLQPTPQGDMAHAEAYLPVILAALRAEGIAVPAAAAAAIDALGHAAPAPHPPADNVELLEALREVSKVYASAELLVSRHIVQLFTACEDHSQPAVRAIAGDALSGWRHLVLAHLTFLADPVAALNPLAMFREADQQGAVEVPLPDHVKLALEGTLPPVKQKPQLAPLESAQALPQQHVFQPAADDAKNSGAAKAKQEGVARQSISFGGVEHGTTPGATPNPTPAAAGALPGLLSLQGHRTDKTVSSTPCLAGGAEDNRDHDRERVTPQLVPETAAHQDGMRQGRGDEHMQGQDEDMRASEAQGQQERDAVPGDEAMVAADDATEGNALEAAAGGAGAGASDAAASAENAAGGAPGGGGEQGDGGEAGARSNKRPLEHGGPDVDAAHAPGNNDSEMVSERNTPEDALAAAEGATDADQDEGAVELAPDDAASGSREAVAPEDTGEELEGPEGCEAAETDAGDDAGDVAGDAGAVLEAGHTEEGGGETMASGHTSGASKAASATSRAEAQEGFDEAAVAETLKAMPVPSDPSVNEVYTYVQKLRLVLNKVPRGSLPALCRRVVEATQQMLQHAPPAESQAIPANEMMKSTAIMLTNVSEGLLPNMAPSEHLEVIMILEGQLIELEGCLQFHQSVFHQTTAAGE